MFGLDQMYLVLFRLFSTQIQAKPPCQQHVTKLSSTAVSVSMSLGVDQTCELLAARLLSHFGGAELQESLLRRRSIDTRRIPTCSWIGICGVAGSGKTTIAQALATHLCAKGIPTAVVPMDGFHYTQQYFIENQLDYKRKGASWTFDVETMSEQLQRIQQGYALEINLPGYSRVVSDPIPNQIQLNQSHQVVLVEGLYLLLGKLWDRAQMNDPDLLNCIGDWDYDRRSIQDEIRRWIPVTNLFDEVWYVEPPSNTSIGETNSKYYARLLNRMMKTWNNEKTILWGGGTAYEAAIRKINYNDVPNGRFIKCCKPYADLIIQND